MFQILIYFLLENYNPPPLHLLIKVTQLYPSNPSLTAEVFCSPLTPSHLENLVRGSIPLRSSPHMDEGGCHYATCSFLKDAF